MNEMSEASLERDRIMESVSYVRTAFNKRSPDDKKFLCNRVVKLIEYVTGRIDYYENARSRIFTASATLLGFGVGVLTFGMDYLADAPWLLSVLFLIAAAFVSMLRHLAQTLRSFFFRKGVPSPWFYKGNIPNFKDKGYHKAEEGAQKAFYKDFKLNYPQLAKEDLAGAFEKDVEQLVILYAILAYKEKNVSWTTKTIEWGLVLFILSLIILFVVNLAMP